MGHKIVAQGEKYTLLFVDATMRDDASRLAGVTMSNHSYLRFLPMALSVVRPAGRNEQTPETGYFVIAAGHPKQGVAAFGTHVNM